MTYLPIKIHIFYLLKRYHGGTGTKENGFASAQPCVCSRGQHPLLTHTVQEHRHIRSYLLSYLNLSCKSITGRYLDKCTHTYVHTHTTDAHFTPAPHTWV